MRPDERSGRRAFFGRRVGHKLRPRQAALFATLLPRLALDLTAPLTDVSKLFPGPVDRVRLEIGFGGGEHLLAEALREPGSGFIGIEPFVNGMAKALTAIETHKLGNVRLHHGDAADVLSWLPKGALARVDLIYPDPWPKRRHWKRRFVQEASLAEIARVLRGGGEFRFASDIADYVAWTLERAVRRPELEWTAERADDFRLPWDGYTMTRYGRKAEREGRKATYLRFRRL